MLEVSATADAARRLMDALEASRVSPGTGAVSDSRGTVPRELAEAFRALLEADPASSQTTVVDASNASNANAARATEAPQGASVVDRAGTSTPSNLTADAVPPTGASGAARPAQAQLMSPLELYRTQFATNMQVFEGKFFSSVSNQAQSQVEETLKSSS